MYQRQVINTVDFAIRIAAGAGFGAAIGLERQWRSKMAGLRTNALVSLGSTLFVLMGAYAFGAGGRLIWEPFEPEEPVMRLN